MQILKASKTISHSGEDVTFTVLKAGNTTITATATINGVEQKVTCEVNINAGFVLQPWMMIVAAIVVVLFLIIIISSSKARKKVKKAIKKKAKSAYKKKKEK